MTHVVMFQFPEPADAAAAARQLRGMAGRVAGLRSVRAGTGDGNGPGGHNLVLVTEHDDADGLATYLADPVHREVGGWIRERATSRAVVDTADLS